MKKIVCFLCVVFCSVLFLSSCGTKKEIKSIVVDGVKYNSFYIYSFENANIIDDYKILYKSNVDKPTQDGYVRSNEQLNQGEDVVVWEQFYFKYQDDNATSISSSDIIHCTAKVIKLEKEYTIDLDEDGGRYIITCYSASNNKSDTDLDRLESNSIEKIVLDVPKQDVIIEYNE